MIETARLVPGSLTPIGDGINDADRCVLELPDGRRRAAILKRLARPAVLAEAFSALLLRSWGLSVPDPYLVEDGDELQFASADATYPSLKQRMGLKHLPEGSMKDALETAACQIVAGLRETPLATVADEAIDNRDRNLGNVLWDGANVAWIDHELALGLATHYPDINKLAIMAQRAGQTDKMRQSTVALWMSLDRQAPEYAGLEASTPHYAQQVADRLTVLGTRLLARFPAPKELLSEP